MLFIDYLPLISSDNTLSSYNSFGFRIRVVTAARSNIIFVTLTIKSFNKDKISVRNRTNSFETQIVYLYRLLRTHDYFLKILVFA